MIASRRFTLFATSISAALLLSACQPATEDTEVMPAEEAITTTTEPSEAADDMVDAHAGHDMSESGDVVDEAQMTDMLKDYTKSMTSMHNEMMVGMGYNDPDTAFAKGMLGHHRGAVDMAKIELKYGTDETMRKLAQDIIDSQQIEIDIMNKWLASHPDAPKPNTEAMQAAYAKGMNTMHSDMMLGIAEPEADMAFARGMLPHHIGAVDMAKVQLQYGTDEEMRKLAQDIIDAQQPEIALMQNWITAHKANKATVNDDAEAVTEDEKEIKENTKS